MGVPVDFRLVGPPLADWLLVMFDLVFIVFDSANLSLAFDTLFDARWSCRSTFGLRADTSSVRFLEVSFFSLDRLTKTQAAQAVEPICSRQRTLAAFLFLALCAWIATFTVSVFR